MSDIAERLRANICAQKEIGTWGPAVDLDDLEEAAAEIERQKAEIERQKAEIERLRGRLEIDPSHPYDGIYCRDETIRGLEKEIERLRAGGCARDQSVTQYCAEAAKKDAEIASLLNTLADARTESMKLRAALERIINVKPYYGAEADEMLNIARAALEGK